MAPEIHTRGASLMPIRSDGPAGTIKSGETKTPSNSAENTQDFEALFKQHHRRVYSICLRMTRNQADAEDLTQDVFVQVFRKLASFRGESAFSTWLYRLTVNHVFMHFRKTRVRKEKVTDDGELPIVMSKVGSKLGRVVLLDRLALDEAMIKLPPGYRMVFILHDVEGLEHREIARILGCSIGTSKSQLHRARMRLRDLLRAKTQTGNHDIETSWNVASSLVIQNQS